MPAYPYDLAWPDVDPTTNAFDAGEVHDVVRTYAPPVPWNPRSDARPDPGLEWVTEVGHPWRAAMSLALEDHYGPWACGWWWSIGDGGPVGAWCCPRHSIGTPAATLAIVTGALWEWRRWLEVLAGAFADGEDETAVAARVTARNAEAAEHLRQVLTWRVEASADQPPPVAD